MDHAVHRQILDGDDAVGVDDAAGVLVREVRAPVSDALVDPRHNHTATPAFGRGPFALFGRRLFCQAALSLRQRLLVPPEEAGVGDLRPIREGRERGQAHVNADGAVGRGQRMRLHLTGERDEPRARRRAPHAAGLDVALQRAVDDGFDVADLGQKDTGAAQFVPRLRIPEGVVLAVPFEAGIPRFLARLDTSEERLEREVDLRPRGRGEQRVRATPRPMVEEGVRGGGEE